MITIICRGGPIDGQIRRLQFDPKTFTKHAERKALGLPNGHYVTKPIVPKLMGLLGLGPTAYVAQWVTLKPCMWRELGMRQARERLARLNPRMAWRGLGE